MNRIFQLFHRELPGMHQAALILAGATITSNMLGLVRDRLLAATFGAGVQLDIYYAAFRVPDFLYALSLFLAASTAVIPVFLETVKSDERRAQNLIASLAALFLTGMGVILVAAFFLMPWLIENMLPSFADSERATAVILSRILLLSPLLLGFSNLISSVIQSYRRFFVYALSPLFYNLGIILGIIFLLPRYGLEGLVWGVVLGAFLHVVIQLPSLAALGFLPRLNGAFPKEAREVLRLSFPRTLGLAANQLAFIVMTGIASTLGAGSIAIFNLSYNLQSLPLAIIGLSYSAAAFPTFAELVIKNERRVFAEHLTTAARHIIFWTLPAAVLFIVLRAQIVRTILGAGAFDWQDTRLTAACLAIFAVGVVAQSLAILFVRAFYAMGKTAVPVMLSILSGAVTVGSALLFVHVLASSDAWAETFAHLLRVGDVEGIAVLGLPLAFTMGSLAHTILLGFGFSYLESDFKKRKLLRSLLDIVIASLAMGVVSYSTLSFFANIFNLDTFWGIFLQGLLAGLAGIVVAVLFLLLRRNQEFMEIWQAIHMRFQWGETVAPEPEHLP